VIESTMMSSESLEWLIPIAASIHELLLPHRETLIGYMRQWAVSATAWDSNRRDLFLQQFLDALDEKAVAIQEAGVVFPADCDPHEFLTLHDDVPLPGDARRKQESESYENTSPFVLPLTRPKLSMPEQVACLVAIHDAIWLGGELIDPFPECPDHTVTNEQMATLLELFEAGLIKDWNGPFSTLVALHVTKTATSTGNTGTPEEQHDNSVCEYDSSLTWATAMRNVFIQLKSDLVKVPERHRPFFEAMVRDVHHRLLMPLSADQVTGPAKVDGDTPEGKHNKSGHEGLVGSNKRTSERYEGRNDLWCKWWLDEECTDAQIRDRWNAMTDEERRAIDGRGWEKVRNGEKGSDVIKSVRQRRGITRTSACRDASSSQSPDGSGLKSKIDLHEFPEFG
jgi:hypothetical protein